MFMLNKQKKGIAVTLTVVQKSLEENKKKDQAGDTFWTDHDQAVLSRNSHDHSLQYNRHERLKSDETPILQVDRPQQQRTSSGSTSISQKQESEMKFMFK